MVSLNPGIGWGDTTRLMYCLSLRGGRGERKKSRTEQESVYPQGPENAGANNHIPENH